MNIRAILFKCLHSHDDNFFGHLIPATIFFIVGVSFLVLILCRVRRLSATGGGDYCQHHVPENNRTLLRVAGIITVCITTFGIILEGVSGCTVGVRHAGYDPKTCFVHLLGHQTLYLAYGSVGFIAVLESAGKLPPDSWRASIALASLSSYFLWYQHAVMKEDVASTFLHMNIARVCLAQATAITASLLFFKSNLPLYMAGIGGLFVLYALAIATAGVHCFSTIPKEIVTPIFVLEIVVVYLIVAVSTAFCCGENHHRRHRGRYYDSSSSETDKTELQSLKQEEEAGTGHVDYKYKIDI